MSSGSKNTASGDGGAKRSADAVSEASNDGGPVAMRVTSDEVNYLVFRYLQESGFVHSAFTFVYESMLGRTNMRNAHRNIPPGALISFLQKGLQYVGIEESLHREATKGRKSSANADEPDFSLLSPHTISVLTRTNPPIQLNVPPATAAAAVKARLEAEAKLQAERLQAERAAAAAVAVSSVADQLASNTSLTNAPVATVPQQEMLNPAQASVSIAAQNALAAQAAVAQAEAVGSSRNPLKPTAVMPPLAAETASAAALAFATQQQQQQQRLAVAELAGYKQQKQRMPTLQEVAQVDHTAVPNLPPAAASGQLSGGKRTADKKGTGKGKPSKQQKVLFGGPQNALHLLSQAAPGFAMEDPVARLGASKQTAPKQSLLTAGAAAAAAASISAVAPGRPERMDVPNELSFGAPVAAAHLRLGAAGQIPELLNGQRLEHNGHALPLNGGQNTTTKPHGVTASDVVMADVSAQKKQQLDAGVAPRPETEMAIDREDQQMNASPSEILELRMHSSEVFMCAWNPVFTGCIATGSGDASARIWQMGGPDASAGLGPVRLLPHGEDPRDKKNKDVTTLEWSSDGKLLATGSYDGVARVWSRNGALLHTLRGHKGPIFSLKWNKRGNYLLSGSYDKTTIVWDVSGSTGFVEQQFHDHQAPALDVDWKDDTTFASCSTDKTVHICKVGVSAPLKTYAGHTDEVNAVKWDPSGNLLASCSDDCTAKVWDVASNETGPLQDFKSHQQEIYTVKWSPTGPGSRNHTQRAMLATASFDGSVRLWNVQDGSCIRVFSRHRDSVYSVAFSPSGNYLASGSLAGQLYIWDVHKGRPVKSYKGKGDIFEVAWNKEETRVAACFSSNIVSILDFKLRR